ncbi:MAG: hypothetical protein L0154_20920 [Chloroflexi bacterium]|nr:hypothetical protein [Chloroflexota bacterium]
MVNQQDNIIKMIIVVLTVAFTLTGVVHPSLSQNDEEAGFFYYAVHLNDRGTFDESRSGYYWQGLDGSGKRLVASSEHIIARTEGLLKVESISPDGNTVLYLAQQEGLEATNILGLDLNSGDNTAYTSTTGDANWNPVWSRDGTVFSYLSGDPFRSFASTVNVYDLNSGESYHVYSIEESGFIIDTAWSSTGHRLAALEVRLTGDNYQRELHLVLFDRAGTPQGSFVLPESVAELRPALHGDNVFAACGTDSPGDICRFHVPTGAFETVVSLKSFVPNAHTITNFDITPDGQELVVLFTNYEPDPISGFVPPDGKTYTYRVNLATRDGVDLSGAPGEIRTMVQMASGGTTSAPVVGEQIVFVAESAEGPDLYVMRVNGEDVRQLTRTPEITEQMPVWSPDGQQVAFIGADDPENVGNRYRKRGFIMNANGSNVRIADQENVETLFSPPAWSPDGSTVLFVANVTAGLPDIIAVDGSTGVSRNLTNDEFWNSSPEWSPDGQWIVFESNPGGGSTIHIMNPDGSQSQSISDCNGGRPAWSPDGEWIAFVSDCLGPEGIYRMRPDGLDIEVLTEDLSIVGLFSWSPDGRYLAFNSGSSLYTVDVETKVVQQISDNASLGERPSWSSDSAWLTFAGEVDGQFDIFRAHPDDAFLENLTVTPDINESSPVWSPAATAVG